MLSTKKVVPLLKFPRESPHRSLLSNSQHLGESKAKATTSKTNTMSTVLALLCSCTSPVVDFRQWSNFRNSKPNSINLSSYPPILCHWAQQFQFGVVAAAAANLCEQETLTSDSRSVTVTECFSETELLAAVYLRIRTFYKFNQATYNTEVVPTALLNFHFSFFGIRAVIAQNWWYSWFCLVLLGSQDAFDGAGVRVAERSSWCDEDWVQEGYLHQCHAGAFIVVGVCTLIVICF